MILRNVGADEQNHIGRLQVFICAGRTIAAEGSFVAGDCGGHAESGIAVVVVGAKAELHQLAQSIELLSHQLAGAYDAERFRPVLLLHLTKSLHESVDGFVPTNASELAIFAQQWILGAVFSVDCVVLGQAFGAELAEVDRVIGVAADADHFAVAHTQLHSAANRAVSAGTVHPAIGVLARGSKSEDRIFAVAVFRRTDIESALPCQPVHKAHAASTERYSVAMFVGTTLTKNR